MRLPADHVTVPCEVRSLGSIGSGLFVTDHVPAGEILAYFGGRATPAHVFRTLSASRQHHSIQVGDDVYMVSDEEPSKGDFINHSCDPTGVLIGEITLAAARDLAPGDQLTFDYATADSTPYDEFECECGTELCRDKVTGEDWMNPDLHERYRGHFSPYLQRRIDALHR